MGRKCGAEEARSLIHPAETTGFRPQNRPGSTARNSVLWGGISQPEHPARRRHKLSFNNTYNRSADNEATELAGENEEFAVDLEVTRLTFVERTVRSHQLTGEHLLGEHHLVDWSLSSSIVKRDEPDRSDVA